jgi:lysozyme
MRLHRSFLALAALPFLLAACGAGNGEEDGDIDSAEQAIKICPGQNTLQGVDVSGYQPNTNWTAVKGAGISFAIIKATEGTGYVNPYFASDWKGTKAVGIVRGAYHYFHADTDPIAQADHFISTVGALEATDLPLVMDLEETFGQTASTINTRAVQFLQRLEQKTGKTPMIYTSPSFYSSLGSPASFAKYTLWIAHWGVQCPTVPDNWNKLTFWQYSDTGNVAGISGGVDHDLFNGSLADLYAFASGGATLPAQLTGNDAISMVNWPDKHAEVFVVDSKGTVQHAWSDAGDTWSTLAAIDGGPASCGHAAGLWPAPKGTPEVFAPAPGGATVHSAWNGSSWDALSDFAGKDLSHFSTLAWPDGHLEVFALGGDATVWHRYWTGNAWSDWGSMGGTAATGVGPMLWGDNHAEIFVADKDGVCWHNFSGSGAQFPGGWFEKWLSIEGTIASRPIPVRWADGHIETFARGTDGHLVHSYYDAAQNKWIPWEVLSPGVTIQGEPSVVMNPEGAGASAGPEVFARDANGKAVHLWWSGGKFNDFTPLGDQPIGSDPFGWIRADGRGEVFAIDPTGTLLHTYRGDQGWTTWAAIGDSTDLDTCVPGSGAGGEGGAGGAGGSGAGVGGSSGPGGYNPDAYGSNDRGSCACRLDSSSEAPRGLFLLGLAPLLAWRRRSRARRA